MEQVSSRINGLCEALLMHITQFGFSIQIVSWCIFVVLLFIITNVSTIDRQTKKRDLAYQLLILLSTHKQRICTRRSWKRKYCLLLFQAQAVEQMLVRLYPHLFYQYLHCHAKNSTITTNVRTQYSNQLKALPMQGETSLVFVFSFLICCCCFEKCEETRNLYEI